MDLVTVNKNQLIFSSVSALSFLIFTAAMYHIYGHTFLHETYLYHITRTDHRHNFSVYFYHLYLTASSSTSSQSRLVGLAAFLPQVAILVSLALRYPRSGRPRDLVFCLFLQTLTFVAFNKICTSQVPTYIPLPLLPSSFLLLKNKKKRHFLTFHLAHTTLQHFFKKKKQYFIWYFSLLPLVLYKSHLSPWKAISLFLCWLATQVRQIL